MWIECETKGTPVWRVQMRGHRETELVLDFDACLALAALFEEAAAVPHCRVVLLEGMPGTFCRGMDLEAVAREGDATKGARAYARALQALHASPKATVAVVDGVALGGGVGLAAAADVVVATSRASFGLPEVMFGIVPAIVLPALIDRVGAPRARLLAMTANSIEAPEALACGLIDEICDDPEHLGRALRRCVKSLLRGKPEALATLKAHLSTLGALSGADAFAAGAELTSELASDRDNLAAIQAFLSGELPSWVDTAKGWKWS